MPSASEWLVAAMGQQQDEAVEAVVALCPWMEGFDVEALRRVLAAHFGMVCGQEVDLGEMAEDVLMLAGRAEVVGDRRRQFAFEQWYGWACAALRGEEYQEAEMPAELAMLP